ncbi:MAG: hypothetical protein M3373_13000, partial [Gemmatimonadota bacterium]|nr:hypothetical protein [Gemmatimonadota bacterium]
MVRTFLVAALGLAIAGCASRVPTERGLAPDTGWLEARLYAPSHGSLKFWINQPAHVAIFEVAPGRGTSLLYPFADWQQHDLGAGFSYAPVSRVIPGRWFYHEPASYVRYGYEPTYLVMIASERPLRLRAIQENPGFLRRRVGYANFTAVNLWRSMRTLAHAVVQDTAADGWAMDHYIVLPPLPRSSGALASAYFPGCGRGVVGFGFGYIPPICVPLATAQAESPPAVPDSASGRRGLRPNDTRPTPPRLPTEPKVLHSGGDTPRGAASGGSRTPVGRPTVSSPPPSRGASDRERAQPSPRAERPLPPSGGGVGAS